MEDIYKEMHSYLNMEEVISLEEFDGYYKKVLAYFDEHNEAFDEDQLWKGIFISENLLANAESRAESGKKKEAKKFNKIGQRMSLWAQNLSARILAKGYTEEQMKERYEKMFEDGKM